MGAVREKRVELLLWSQGNRKQQWPQERRQQRTLKTPTKKQVEQHRGVHLGLAGTGDVGAAWNGKEWVRGGTLPVLCLAIDTKFLFGCRY